MENQKENKELQDMLPPGSAPIYTHSLEYLEEYNKKYATAKNIETLENALTLDEAIDKGYKYCNIEEFHERSLTSLSDLKDGSELWDPTETTFYLCDKEPGHHSIDVGVIEELIQEKIDETEDYYSEDGFPFALEGCDDLIKQLANKINNNLARKSFYFIGDKMLLPNP